MTAAALIVAGGRGARAAAVGLGPKQYVPLCGKAVLAHTIEALAVHPLIGNVSVVIHKDDAAAYEALVSGLNDPTVAKLRPPATGGATRQQSVFAGLESLSGANFQSVLIHDAARPLVSTVEVSAVLKALAEADGAVLATPVSDTLKRADEIGAYVDATVSRKGLWQALTPQGFTFEKILAAHRSAAKSGRDDFTDDASVAEAYGMNVAIVPGRRENIKITTPEDFELAARMMASGTPDVRTGNGYDVHKFAQGNAVWLCGIEVPHTHCLAGHSDADVGLHALTDAILGALGEGDIGHHFPPSDPQWKGASSDRFLAHAARLVAERGGTITHTDVTLICEAPKIGPYRDAMRTRIAEIIGTSPARISVKATTSEGLGFTGRKEGIAAMATATVVLPGNCSTL